MTNNVDSQRHLFWWGGLLIFILLIILTIFSSPLPDGLEWVAHRLGFVDQEKPFFPAPLADYTISSGLSPAANQILSAILGVSIIVVFLLALSRLLKHSNKGGSP